MVSLGAFIPRNNSFFQLLIKIKLVGGLFFSFVFAAAVADAADVIVVFLSFDTGNDYFFTQNAIK